MKALPLLFITMLTSGCALSPAEVRERGSKVEVTYPRPPSELAPCMQRNAENQSGFITARTSALRDGTIELVVRTQDGGAMAVYDLRSSGPGALITGHVDRSDNDDPMGATRSLLRGC